MSVLGEKDEFKFEDRVRSDKIRSEKSHPDSTSGFHFGTVPSLLEQGRPHSSGCDCIFMMIHIQLKSITLYSKSYIYKSSVGV